ncbi:MAG: hypothetical protein JJ863_14940 [Deltaproteobacteria bacterium]|nr:hypothetical protein [Deltaproteobacteria bacterium]
MCAALCLVFVAGCGDDDGPPVVDDMGPVVGDGGGMDGGPVEDGGVRCREDSECDDGLDCTEDVCDTDARRCLNLVIEGSCNDSNSCTTDTCDMVEGCLNVPFDEGADCVDSGGAAGMCMDGACSSGCTMDSDCADAFPCTVNTCDDTTGTCQPPTFDDSVCDDANPCTADTCGTAGCQNSLVADGTDCSGVGGAAGTCSAGTCITGCTTDAECDDGVSCTTDTCDTGIGACSNLPDDGACDDGVACTVDSCSAATGCTAMPMNSACDDGIGCTSDSCDAAAGCVFTPVDMACDDSVDCTIDVCSETSDCSRTPDNSECDDMNSCTANTCDMTGGCGTTNVAGGTPCVDGAGANGLCDGSGTCQVACTTDADCADADMCNGAETCDTSDGTCVAGTAPDCDDGVGCTDDSCVTATGCSNVANDANCNDGNPCTTGSCDMTGDCAQANVADTTACTVGGSSGQCQSGSCIIGCTTDAECDDGHACTADSCNLTSGSCEYTTRDGMCDDGVDCTNDTCTLSGCTFPTVNANCDDSNECTTNMCTASGCTSTNIVDGTPCDDAAGDAGLCMAGSCSVECTSAADCQNGNACDGAETCSVNGQCRSGTAPDCNDMNACTTDSCDMSAGCQNVAITCNDTTSCTTDSCDTGMGCVYTPQPTSCDDGNECTSQVCTSMGGGDGCSNPPVVDGTSCMAGTGTCQAGTCLTTNPTTFRFNSMVLQDPHVIVDNGFPNICADVTNDPYNSFLVDIPPLNGTLAEDVTMDSDGDGFFDLGIVVHFPDLDRSPGATGMGRVVESECSTPDPSDCTPVTGTATDVTAGYTVRRSGSCTPGPVTTHMDSRTWPDGEVSAPNTPTAGSAGCFITDPVAVTLAFEVSGATVAIPLENAQLAAQFDAAETTLSNGVLVGFLSEAVADAITISVSIVTLSLGEDLLPEPDHCTANSPDARDMDGGTRGWWFTLNLGGTVANGTGY